ncbi:unnamed protein product [Trichogramma brassicae]|uniref:Uncharacterized protein n=1 Tax=Trichogramma brassicae TaxID=86971 RepID=A0A6H5I3Z5_9HYME|nr:unnamed protein product [Trichogramma brassicae]
MSASEENRFENQNDNLRHKCDYCALIIDFVIRTGYRDEPKLGTDGKPLAHRITAVHYAAGYYNRGAIISELFKIYDRFDVNYVDEKGITHFHIACEVGCRDLVEKFLELGQDPNCFVSKSGDSLLHLALDLKHIEVAKLLTRHGSDPNLANEKKSTPLHYICTRRRRLGHCRQEDEDDKSDLIRTVFEINDKKHRLVQVNARDKFGDTPLHLAVKHDYQKVAELLLRRGADPNLANEEGSTPLHVICQRTTDDDLTKKFFEICSDIEKTVLVDAKDSRGRTALQLAVANLLPGVVGVLLTHGSDLTKFIVPNESEFVHHRFVLDCRLLMACRILICVQRLEEKGYELDRDDALTIMKLYCESRFRTIPNIAELRLFCNDEKLAEKRKTTNVREGLLLHDLIQLDAEEVTKRVTYQDCYELANSVEYWKLSIKFRRACNDHLCDKLPRRLFLRWTLDPFMELINYRLPHLPCEMILNNLENTLPNSVSRKRRVDSEEEGSDRRPIVNEAPGWIRRGALRHCLYDKATSSVYTTTTAASGVEDHRRNPESKKQQQLARLFHDTAPHIPNSGLYRFIFNEDVPDDKIHPFPSFGLSYTHFFFVNFNLEAKTHYGAPIHFRQSALRIYTCPGNLLLSDSMNGCRSPGTTFASYSTHSIRGPSIFIFILIFVNSTALTFQMNK